MMKVFNERIPDQRLSLAETFSGPIFQITGLMGFTWVLYGSSKGTDISFINEGIQYQMPLLLGVSILKYFVVFLNKFKVSRKMFYINLIGYTLFAVAVILIDYRIEFFGPVGAAAH